MFLLELFSFSLAVGIFCFVFCGTTIGVKIHPKQTYKPILDPTPSLSNDPVFFFSFKDCSYLFSQLFPLSFLLENFNEKFLLPMRRKQLLSGSIISFHFLFYMNLSNIQQSGSLPSCSSFFT